MSKKDIRRRVNLSFKQTDETENLIYNILKTKNRKASQYVIQAVLFFEQNKGMVRSSYLISDEERNNDTNKFNFVSEKKEEEKTTKMATNKDIYLKPSEEDRSITIDTVSSEPEDGDLDIFSAMGGLWMG